MTFNKKFFLTLLAALLIVFSVGCEKDSALPKNAPEETNETVDETEKDADLIEEESPSNTEDESNAEDSIGEADTDLQDDDGKAHDLPASEPSQNSKEQTEGQTNNSGKETTENRGAKDKKDEQNSNQQPATLPKVTVSVQGLDGKMILSPTTVSIEPEFTVLIATTKILDEKGIQFEYRGIGDTAYMEGIDNLYEMDHGPLSGWLYKKNGKVIGRSSGAEPVKDGDIIEWIYSLDMTAN